MVDTLIVSMVSLYIVINDDHVWQVCVVCMTWSLIIDLWTAQSDQSQSYLTSRPMCSRLYYTEIDDVFLLCVG